METQTNQSLESTGQVDSPSETVFIRHIRIRNLDGTYSNGGGATIAFREAGNGIEYALSYCAPRDNFNRKVGREISIGRLNSGGKTFVGEMSVESFEAILDYVCQEDLWLGNDILSEILSDEIEAPIPFAYCGEKYQSKKNFLFRMIGEASRSLN